MTTRTISALEFPPSDPDFERALGQFVIAWGQLEGEIDCAIEELFDVPEQALSGVLTANLGTKAKLDIFHAAMHELVPEWKDNALLKEVDRLVEETITASNRYRTRYAHGQPTLAPDESGTDRWVWIKWAARKGGLKGVGTAMKEISSDIARHVTTGLIVEWHEMRGTIEHYKSGGLPPGAIQRPDKGL